MQIENKKKGKKDLLIQQLL